MYKISCVSIEGEYLSFAIEDLLKALLKEDDTLLIIERHYQMKTKQDEYQSDEDSDDEDMKKRLEVSNKISKLETSNAMKLFRRKQINSKLVKKEEINQANQVDQATNNFRSLLLNQKELDYRETIKEVIDEYPLIQ